MVCLSAHPSHHAVAHALTGPTWAAIVGLTSCVCVAAAWRTITGFLPAVGGAIALAATLMASSSVVLAMHITSQP